VPRVYARKSAGKADGWRNYNYSIKIRKSVRETEKIQPAHVVKKERQAKAETNQDGAREAGMRSHSISGQELAKAKWRR